MEHTTTTKGSPGLEVVEAKGREEVKANEMTGK
jgi:hypothetical protein